MSVHKEVKRVTTHVLQAMKARGEKIAMLTAYDYSMARILDEAGGIIAELADDISRPVMNGIDGVYLSAGLNAVQLSEQRPREQGIDPVPQATPGQNTVTDLDLSGVRLDAWLAEEKNRIRSGPRRSRAGTQFDLPVHMLFPFYET